MFMSVQVGLFQPSVKWVLCLYEYEINNSKYLNDHKNIIKIHINKRYFLLGNVNVLDIISYPLFAVR